MIPVVREINGIPKFPKEIPNKRSNHDVPYRIFTTTALLACGCYFTDADFYWYIYGSTTYSILFYTFQEILSRSLSLIEEYRHINSRYNNSVFKLLSAVYWFNKYSFTSILVAILSIPIVRNCFIDFTKETALSGILSLIAVRLYTDLIKFDECPMNEAKQLDDSKGTDYGSGIAHSFFHGYLNIILPCTGTESKGLKELMTDFESEEGIEFPVKKLFLLIPMSGYCPTKITEQSKIADYSKSLKSHVRDRAGTRDRVYHSTVYKLYRDPAQLPVYVCAEYATPLKTLHEVMDKSNSESSRYRKYYTELVTNFYMTIRQLVRENRSYCDLCEFIYYKDDDEFGDNPNLDVGKLLLEKIDGIIYRN